MGDILKSATFRGDIGEIPVGWKKAHSSVSIGLRYKTWSTGLGWLRPKDDRSFGNFWHLKA